jgi:5-methylthioadenosine/S-adenosylhomocysteine deaminase
VRADGAASNNGLNLLAEIQTAALIHKGVRLDPLAIPAVAALEMATIGGARALKLDHLIGSLDPKKRADLVIIDLDEDNLVPLYDPVSHLAYAVEAADVRTVVVDGRIVLRDGVLTTPMRGRSEVKCARLPSASDPSGEAGIPR